MRHLHKNNATGVRTNGRYRAFKKSCNITGLDRANDIFYCIFSIITQKFLQGEIAAALETARDTNHYSGRAKLTFKCREFAATPSRKR